jgi:Xaa-Pro aminopeptidase
VPLGPAGIPAFRQAGGKGDRLAMDYTPQRRGKLGRLLKKDNLDAVLVTSASNVAYLSGFSGNDSWLLVTPKKAFMLTDGRFTVQIAEECPGVEPLERRKKMLQKLLEGLARKLKIKRLAFESRFITVAAFQALEKQVAKVELVPWDQKIETLRVVKDRTEIAAIREAVAIAEKAMEMFRAMLTPGLTEREAARDMVSYIRRAGGTDQAFGTIVATDDRAALPHAPLTDGRPDPKRMLLVDWGACGKFYRSDLTRTYLTRKISPKVRKVYEAVLGAQKRAIKKIRPGARARDIDAEARRYIAKAGFGRAFKHGLGHGLGLDVHEAPGVGSRSDATSKLKAGMVITVEPGIYLPGWGGVRIEDDVLVTRDGCEVLTSAPKELDEMMIL